MYSSVVYSSPSVQSVANPKKDSVHSTPVCVKLSGAKSLKGKSRKTTVELY